MNGLADAGKQTVHDVLTLKGMRDASSHVAKNYSGKMKDLVKTPEGRKTLRNAVGKSLPSAVALGAYGAIGKKMYNKMKSENQNQYDQQYYT